QQETLAKEKNKLDQANARLREMDAFKSRFFTNISHEFRTPLTVIKGINQQIQKQPEKWQDRGHELIEQNSNQLLNLINQILELRKLESGSLTFTLIHGNIIPHLQYIAESFHSLAENKNIEIHFQSEEPEMNMDYDPEKITRIIANLIANAIKFTPDEGKVFLHVKELPKEGLLEIKIEDTGVGIPSEKLPYIFDRFYQAESDNTRSGEGTGIGLALVKELVSLLEGEIFVNSTPDKGTIFTIHLPVKRSLAGSDPSQTNSQIISENLHSISPFPVWASTGFDPENDRPSLLIVEDNPSLVEYLTSCLEDLYQIDVARNGQEGIDKALEVIPDLIISDVMMPLKDGLEVCNTLKKDPRTSHIPIILLTAKADIESRLAGFTYGANAYLTKPFNQQELLIRMKNLLDERLNLQARYQSLNPIQ
ncbi:MAG: response regulator, partial [Bacteroidetes bacterium]|nr:response regulator [Bacteroidota bacterium]